MTQAQVRALAEIHQHLAACTQAGDARKAEAYAAGFTANGILQLQNETITGREAILSWMAAPSVIPAPAEGTPGFISHHLTTCHVDLPAPTEPLHAPIGSSPARRGSITTASTSISCAARARAG